VIQGVFREPPSPNASLTGATANTIPLQFIPAQAAFTFPHLAQLRGYQETTYSYPQNISHSLGLGVSGLQSNTLSIPTTDDTSGYRSDLLTTNLQTPTTISQSLQPSLGITAPHSLSPSLSVPTQQQQPSLSSTVPPRSGVAITRSSSGVVGQSLLGSAPSTSPLGTGLGENALLESFASFSVRDSTSSTTSSSSSSLYKDQVK